MCSSKAGASFNPDHKILQNIHFTWALSKSQLSPKSSCCTEEASYDDVDGCLVLLLDVTRPRDTDALKVCECHLLIVTSSGWTPASRRAVISLSSSARCYFCQNFNRVTKSIRQGRIKRSTSKASQRRNYGTNKCVQKLFWRADCCKLCDIYVDQHRVVLLRYVEKLFCSRWIFWCHTVITLFHDVFSVSSLFALIQSESDLQLQRQVFLLNQKVCAPLLIMEVFISSTVITPQLASSLILLLNRSLIMQSETQDRCWNTACDS